MNTSYRTKGAEPGSHCRQRAVWFLQGHFPPRDDRGPQADYLTSANWKVPDWLVEGCACGRAKAVTQSQFGEFDEHKQLRLFCLVCNNPPLSIRLSAQLGDVTKL